MGIDIDLTYVKYFAFEKWNTLVRNISEKNVSCVQERSQILQEDSQDTGVHFCSNSLDVRVSNDFLLQSHVC